MSVDLRSEKTLGLIGSVLTLLGGLSDGAMRTAPFVAFSNLVSLVGLILVLLSLHGISTKLNDERPFRYYLYSVMVAICGLVIFVILVIAGAISAFMARGWGTVVGLSSIVLGLAVLVALIVLSVYYQIQAWRATYEITGVEEFNQVATFLKWGAITLVVLVGVVFLLIAQVYQIIAFSKLPDEMEPKSLKNDTDVVVY